MNPLYEPLPESITADGREFPIVTDFREWFRFGDMMTDPELSDAEKITLSAQWLLEPPERITAGIIEAIFAFYRAEFTESNAEQFAEEDEEEPVPSVPVLSWTFDAPYIIGDFLRYYRLDLMTAEMHWWKFRLLLSALPDDSQMMKRIGYRCIDPGQVRNEAERRRIMRMKQLYALPFEMPDEAIGAVFGGS